MDENYLKQTHRRGFLGMLATGATALGLTALASPFKLNAQQKSVKNPAPAVAKGQADLWFDKIKGSHRVVYDATQPHEIFPFAWPKVFLMTNEATGSPDTDCGVVVVLRHSAIGYAMQDHLWEKYNFADLFKANDHGHAFKAPDAATASKTRNPFLNTSPGDFVAPGIGPIPIGIKDLQASGVLFCVCDAAITVFSAAVAGQLNLDASEVKQEWIKGLIPGIQQVPSGVWAIGRAQEHKCAYIFAG